MWMRQETLSIGAFIILALGWPAPARAAQSGGFEEVQIAGGIAAPTAMEFSPDGRLFVAQQAGRLRVIRNGALLPADFVTLSVTSNSERGLLGIAFDPNFSANGYIYLYYTRAGANPKNRVSRFTASSGNPDVAQAGSELVVLDDIASDAGNHNGGAIHFGPDGKLYVATGDGGAIASNSQSLSTLSGKLLRINPDGSVPADNPFVGTAGARGEIWALGLRNPFTFAFDPQTGKIHINDVGLSAWEEINVGVKGANYGWPVCEGACPNPGFTNPIYSYDHTIGRAITGGTFYRSSLFPASFAGSYFFSDYLGGFIKRLDANNQVSDFLARNNGPVDLKVGPDGALYYLSIFDGAVYRIRPVDNTPPAISNVSAAAATTTGTTITWTTSEASDSQVEYGTTTAYGSQTTLNASLVTSHTQAISGLEPGTTYNYRVKSRDAAGNLATSANFTFTTATPPDTTSPVITNVTASNLSATGATITWTTDEPADSQVEYGLDMTYGSQTARSSSRVRTHSQRLSGLSAATAYNYRVKSRDAAGNLAVSANFTFVTSPEPPGGGGGGGDSTPPRVSISAPGSGTVSGTIVVSATASDDGAVSGVQFMLDGFNLGAEDVTAPYSINWDTLTASNGVHVLTASAVDTARNRATSTGVTVIVRNATVTFSMPPGGGEVWTVSAAPQTVGSARIEPEAGTTAPAGLAIVGQRSGGALIAEAGFPAPLPVTSGRIAVEIGTAVNTGVAIANGGGSDATIQFYFSDASRREFAHGSFVLGANQQLSRFLTQPPFSAPSMQGSFTFVSSGASVSLVAVRGLTNERGEFLFTTLPVSQVQTGPAAASISGLAIPENAELPSNGLLVPHFADGGGWSTQVILTNPSDEPLTGTLQFFAPGSEGEPAAPLQLEVNGRIDSVFAYTVPARASVRMSTGSVSAGTVTGSVHVIPATPGAVAPSVAALYSYRQGGITLTESSISALPMASSYRLYVEASGTAGQPGAIQPAIAIANPMPAPIAVNLELTRLQDGAAMASRTVTIPAGGQLSRFMHELFNDLPLTYRATLRISAPAVFAVAGLRTRYNERGDFLISTTPPASGQPPTGAPLLFPHIVAGDGYSTSLVLFSQTSGAAAGLVLFRTQAGVLQNADRLQRQQ